ncbi:MAG: hypothetical protein J07HX5_01830 [halophilic archaeon J07HX5]|jgi:hypothetical protein|nr:MAG: hypothetical protein J07HX5_01830 [halophilic archaeon J07HX5]
MSMTAGRSDPALSEKQRRILEYLREHRTSTTYFKSRLIADDLDLSSKEVGANMHTVAEAAEFSVEKWGYSSGTTWMVTN